jgi:hypothetical protein
VAVVLLAGLSACGGADPHAAARAQLAGCLAAVEALHPVSVLSVPGYLAAERIAEQRDAAASCDTRTVDALARKHPSDARLARARLAFHRLETGVGDYGGYLDERQSSMLTARDSDLAAARAEIGRGKIAVRQALDELSR